MVSHRFPTLPDVILDESAEADAIQNPLNRS